MRVIQVRRRQLLDAAAGLAVAIYSLAVWWPTRQLPYHWDAATFTIPATRDLLATHFTPLVASHSDFAHTPLLMVLLALTWKVFGATRAVSHALMLPALALAVGGTYALGVALPNVRVPHGDRLLGAAAACVVGSIAVVLEETGQIYAELPAAAATVWALVAYLRGKTVTAALLFSLAALLRVPTVVVPVALSGLACLPLASSRSRRALLRSAPLLLPVAVLIGWFAYHRAAVGWTFSVPGRPSYVAKDPVTVLRGMWAVVEQLLLGQWRWLLLVVAVAGALEARVARGSFGSALARAPMTLLACVAAGCAFFGAFGEFGLRYGLFLLPPFAVACLALARSATWGPSPFVLAAALMLGLFATTWRPHLPPTTAYEFAPPQDLTYLDTISIGTSAARYVEERYPTAEIYGSVPESYQLADTDDGYVTAPHAVTPCASFELHPDRKQLIYRHPYSPGQIACARLIQGVGARLKKRFESNGRWVEIFALPSTTPTTGSAPP